MIKQNNDKNILLNRFLISLFILILIRIGTFLPVPGINHGHLAFYLKRHSLTKLANDAKTDYSIESPEKIMKGEISNYSNLVSLNLSVNKQSMKPLNNCKRNIEKMEYTNSPQKTNKEIDFKKNETHSERGLEM